MIYGPKYIIMCIEYNKTNKWSLNYQLDCYVWFSSFFIKRYYRHTRKQVSQPDMTTNNVEKYESNWFQYVCWLHKVLAWGKNCSQAGICTDFSPSHQPGKNAICQMTYLPVRIPRDEIKDGYNMAIVTEQHVNEKLLVYYFPDLHITSFPVHHVQSCSCRWTQINQIRLLDCHEGWKPKALALPACIWRSFFKCSHY